MRRLAPIAVSALLSTASCADTREDAKAAAQKPPAPEYRAMTRDEVEASPGHAPETTRSVPPAVRLTRGLNKLAGEGWRLVSVEPQQLWFDGQHLRARDDAATYVFVNDE